MGTMKVAIPVWQNRVAPLFDVCQQIKIFELKNKVNFIKLIDVRKLSIANRLKVFEEENIELLICNGISLFLTGCLQSRKIKVFNDYFGDETEVIQTIKS